MISVAAYAVSSPDAKFEKTTIERRELGPRDVLVDIKFVGICHSDIHAARNEWHNTQYPCVPGHEIVGIVAAVGPEVTKHKVADRVAVGCMVNSCGECASCRAGSEQYCARGVTMTYNSPECGGITAGGYSRQIVVTEDFVLSVPDGIDLDVAAPLLCAGITLYAPLRNWKAGPGKRIAIVGLGGLGHLGVKIAKALGAHVTVLSQSLRKRDDGLALGADEYYATSDQEMMKKLRGSFHLILNTVSAPLDTNHFLRLLTLDGTLVILGLPDKPLIIKGFHLADNRRSVAGSMIGGISQTQEMLDFCAAKGITAEIEKISADRIDEAFDRVLASDVRYRFVIDAATF